MLKGSEVQGMGFLNVNPQPEDPDLKAHLAVVYRV